MSRRALRHGPFLALLLALQWGMAFAHCIGGLGGHGLAVEICTVDGLRTLHLDGDGRKEALPAHDSCPLCPGAAALEPAAPALPALRIAYARAVPPPLAGLPPAPARAPPQQPRAPPLA
ncbi:DUF2946 family protein [Siccirubricoccus sp. KC 17139]|uniref:DUF2946 family protein n=1 Tax=Siccirubricoccus soli TaxID=2899147 RepID=A0ABT1DAC2_9PROT|nr:DUF2946 family protein [Siccirubricoccus soli]MCO6418863.1 DUF2946 family protein [Siccirubricoccus soli]MCP2684998.1 DUF2946 family protein [Siccirubricoccus soli]